MQNALDDAEKINIKFLGAQIMVFMVLMNMMVFQGKMHGIMPKRITIKLLGKQIMVFIVFMTILELCLVFFMHFVFSSRLIFRFLALRSHVFCFVIFRAFS